ncbi:NAD(P)/FAD-dependent oxidoreductase [Pleomorphovibrio marinus]|uniref:NAD(P)/FAD-dependent oxidoreductase n=1 Tax=Pleomorphovibrio marinus TaxID=2164132 RepID=UPI000E0BD08C|nr:NAD(P)/FAD-dependent oxidoreductase [Pleomorphovibrio marinus]
MIEAANYCNHSRDRHIVIIGNGISGITCARTIRKRDHHAKITIISGESQHFYSRTALMYLYMGHMRYENVKPYEDFFWEKNRFSLIHDWVTKVDLAEKKLFFKQSTDITYDILIIATGSIPKKFGWKGEELSGVQGFYGLQDLNEMEVNTKDIKHATVVGGGLIGIELCEMLHSRDISVTFLVKDKHFWGSVLPEEEGSLVDRHIREHGVDLRLSTTMEAMEGEGNGKVSRIKTDKGETINTQFVGLAIGVTPNVALFQNTSLEIETGVLVDPYFRTNIPNVFAIGDCAEFREKPDENRKNIEQVWYTGRMHGETLGYNLTSDKAHTYQPGVWFNSAKFFDIEYQTYGKVPATLEEKMGSFYWEHPNGKIGFRITFDAKTQAILGVNALGLRVSHEFFDCAINNQWKINKVMARLNEADFDPEFFDSHITSILQAYNHRFGTQITHKKLSFWSRLTGTSL